MLSLRRGTTDREGGGARGRGLTRQSLAISLAINAAVIALFFQAAAAGLSWKEIFSRGPSQQVIPERIGFVQLPRPAAPAPPTPGRSGGDGRPVSRTTARPAPTPQAPTEIPDEIPPVNPGAAPTTEPGGTGPVVGGGGPTEGIKPSYTDPRLWTRPGAVATAPKTARDRVDSVITDVFGPVRDSIARAQEFAAGQRKPGDWTLNGPGGKWGMDQSSIHLGKVKIPNAVLALLSEQFQRNLRGNPIEIERERRLAQIRQDILDHANREMTEDEFRTAVRRIRERKDKERADKATPQDAKGRIAGKDGGR
jgi:hypothetical protein